MIKKIRLDVLLFKRGIVDSRQKAQRIILAGKVKDLNGRVLDKPGHELLVESQLQISAQPKFVSRGGDKLAQAFNKFPINVKGRICIDAGISTGGFTDCLLQNGAKKIYGIDVGYGQTSWKIRQDNRVILIERTNIRYLDPTTIFEDESILPDFVVADLSFISLKLVLKPIRALLNKNFNEGLFLIKPQFEVGKEFISKGGVVKNPKKHIEVLDSIINFFYRNQWEINGLIASPLVGPAGNHEYLIWVSSEKITNFSPTNEFINNLVNRTLKIN